MKGKKIWRTKLREKILGIKSLVKKLGNKIGNKILGK